MFRYLRSQEDGGCTTNFNAMVISGDGTVGSSTTFSVDAQNGCDDTFYYKWSFHPDYGTNGYNGNRWTTMTGTEYVSDSSVSYTFPDPGKYIATAWVTRNTNNTNSTSEGVPIIGWSVDVKSHCHFTGTRSRRIPSSVSSSCRFKSQVLSSSSG